LNRGAVRPRAAELRREGIERMDEPSREEFSEQNLPPPAGTIFVMGAYMVVLALGWAAMFWLLVDR
jgi:hypothetical protein